MGRRTVGHAVFLGQAEDGRYPPGQLAGRDLATQPVRQLLMQRHWRVVIEHGCDLTSPVNARALQGLPVCTRVYTQTMTEPQNAEATEEARKDARETLERLAAQLDPGVLAAKVLNGNGWPSLKVTSRHASQLTEHIYAGSGWFWWSWAERLAPVGDLAAAAAKITRVLHTSPQPADD